MFHVESWACPDCQQLFCWRLAGAKSAIRPTHSTENRKSKRVLKIDIPSVIDVNKKTKTNMSAIEKLTDTALLTYTVAYPVRLRLRLKLRS